MDTDNLTVSWTFCEGFVINIFYKKILITKLKITSYNHGSNILERNNSLLKFGFTTSKAMIHIYYKKKLHCMRVVSWVSERLKTYDLNKLGSIRQMSKLGGDRA